MCAFVRISGGNLTLCPAALTRRTPQPSWSTRCVPGLARKVVPDFTSSAGFEHVARGRFGARASRSFRVRSIGDFPGSGGTRWFMPVKAGTPLDPDATRARVLSTATQLFYERGVHGVGINEIAERAGASKLTIYRHFRSKDGLVAAMVRERSDQIHDWLVRNISRSPAGRERVLALFDLLTQWYGEDGFHGCLVVNASTDVRGGGGVVPEIARAHLERYRALLEDQLAAAGVGSPSSLARQLLLLIEGATVVTAIERRGQTGDDARLAAEALLDAGLSS